MSHMFGGIFKGRRNDRSARPKPLSAGRPPVPEPQAAADDFEDDALDLDLHFCVCCGRQLGDDREDEIDGEGPGRDICGNCNRERNWLAVESTQGW